jgi:hypothetical protein
MMRLRLPLLLIAAAVAPAQTVRIGVFGLFHPTRLELRGPLAVEAEGATLALSVNETLRCRARAQAVACAAPSGTLAATSISAIPRGTEALTLAVPGRIERRFHGRLELTAVDGALVPVVAMDRETAVASVVAAESPAGAPAAALEAQAVVARSFYSAHSRHRGFDFCDTTHCQFLREPPAEASAAARAVRATRGLVLAWHGATVAALYSARCGGHTRALASASAEEYPFFAVPCPYCARTPRGTCAYCTRTSGAWANRRGAGAGHGIGLCQYGAAAMASAGSLFSAILEHYFPTATLAAAP